MTNIELMQQGYGFFAEGNVPAVLGILAPDIEWRECQGMPFVEGDGVYIGHEAIVTKVFMNLPVYFDGFNIEIKEFIAADNKVVMVGHYTGVNKATGNAFRAQATHVWTVKDGKAIHFFQAVDTATINK
jgi:ketosteroid isomerase-like protein